MRGAVASTMNVGESLIEVHTTPCCVCGARHEFFLDRNAFWAWQKDTHIQHAFPQLSAGDREILISGTCDECFHQLFPPEE